ncbi:MAG: flagellar basal body-associated FliL family protein [Robiginitomaculum sp.]|nr:flagellar basal body-associated FliL family protein [Robiginitomaculum sp.]
MKKPKKEKKKKVKKGGDTPAKKGGMLGKLALVIAMGATSFCTVFFLPRPDPVVASADASDSHAKKTDQHAEPEPVATAFLDMESFTVSLKGRKRVLRLGVTLETPEDMVDFIDPNDPQLRDAFMGYLSAIEMAQVEDATFLVRLRAQLTRRAQFVLGEANVTNILITDFLVR